MTSELSGDRLTDMPAAKTKLEQLHKIQLEERRHADEINKQVSLILCYKNLRNIRFLYYIGSTHVMY